MNYDYTGEKFIDRIFKDIYLSEEVQHTALKSDSREETIRKYMDRLERVHTKASERNRKDLLKSFYFAKYVIKEEDIPKNIPKSQRQDIIDSQRKRLEGWIDYLTDNNAVYPMWAKYWAFQGMLSLGNYDIARNTYQRRTAKTIAPFVEANPAIIANCIQSMVDYEAGRRNGEEINTPLKTGSFKKLYEYYSNKFNEELFQKNNSTDGKWVKYNKGNRDEAIKLCESLQGKGVAWCTANESYAIRQVCGGEGYANGGDFYAYYTKDEEGNYTVPRIAIRMSGHNRIEEIRGAAAGQCLESEMIGPLEEKLKTMEEISGNNIDLYLRKVKDQKKLVDIYTKTVNKKPLTNDEILSLYIDHFGFGYQQDPLVEKTKRLRNIGSDYKELDFPNKIELIESLSRNNFFPEEIIIDEPEVMEKAIWFKYEILKNGTPELKDNKEFITKILHANPYTIEYISDRLKDDKEIALAAVSNYGLLLDCVSNRLKNDKDVVLAAVKNTGMALPFASKRLKNDKEIVEVAVSDADEAFEYAGSKMRDDKDIVMIAIKSCGSNLAFASDRLKDDKEIVSAAIHYYPESIEYASARLRNDVGLATYAINNGCSLAPLGPDIKNNKELAIKSFHNDRDTYYFIGDKLKNDRDIALLSASKNGSSLERMSKEFKDDKKIVMAAVTNSSKALYFASNRLRNDEEVVDVALNFASRAFKYAGNQIRSNPKFILERIDKMPDLIADATATITKNKDFALKAVSINPKALAYAHNSITKSKKVVLKAVSLNGELLDYASPEFKNNKEVVMAAVSNKGTMLNVASKAMKKDRDVVIAAVTNNGNALQCASEELRNDKEIVRLAIAQEPDAFDYAGAHLRNDKEFIFEEYKKRDISIDKIGNELKKDRDFCKSLVSIRGKALKAFNGTLKDDKEIVMKALSDNCNMLPVVSDRLKKDKEVVLKAVTKDGTMLEYASKVLKNDAEVVKVAINEDSYALSHASEEIKSDAKLLTKWFNEGIELDLSYVNEKLYCDKEFMAAAIRNNISNKKYLPTELRDDEDFMLSVLVGRAGYYGLYAQVFKYAGTKLREDKNVVKKAIRINPHTFEYADDSLRYNKEFIIELFNEYSKSGKMEDYNTLKTIALDIPDELRDDGEINSIYTSALIMCFTDPKRYKDVKDEEIYSAIDNVESFAKDLILSDKLAKNQEIVDYVKETLLNAFRRISPEVSYYVDSKYPKQR